MAVAAALASIGSSIAGLAVQNDSLAMGGVICTVISAAIYAAAEAYVDGKACPQAAIDARIGIDAEGAMTTSEPDVVNPAFVGESAFKATE